MEVFSKLALEPTLPKSNVTATSSAIDNSRAHSAIKSWAISLKNALDEGLMFTAKWLAIADVTTANVSTDFAALVGGADEAKVLASAQQRSVISAKTERNELKRRSILGPDAPSDEEEEERIAIERGGLEPEFEIDPRTGEPIDPAEKIRGCGMKCERPRSSRRGKGANPGGRRDSAAGSAQIRKHPRDTTARAWRRPVLADVPSSGRCIPN